MSFTLSTSRKMMEEILCPRKGCKDRSKVFFSQILRKFLVFRFVQEDETLQNINEDLRNPPTSVIAQSKLKGVSSVREASTRQIAMHESLTKFYTHLQEALEFSAGSLDLNMASCIRKGKRIAPVFLYAT